MVPSGGLAGGGSGNTIVRIYLPAGSQGASSVSHPLPPTPAAAPALGAAPALSTPPPLAAGPASAATQLVAINMTGPTSISQTVTVGPNATGCAPSTGGTSCQLALSLPTGTYTGTIGNAAIAFSVAPNASNALNLALSGIPAQVQIVPGSFTSAPNAQGGIDLFGAGKHPLLVELLDANQNVIVGNAGATFSLSQAGGSLPLSVSASAKLTPNVFYVSGPASASAGSSLLRAGVSYAGAPNPCGQAAATCGGTARVDVRQVMAVANSNANTVTLYANGGSAPLATIQTGIASPQALVFDPAGNCFVANQPGSVTEYAPPYNQTPTVITQGVNHPQALAMDGRGDLFVANGNGSNTVTMYSQPYGGAPAQVITNGIDDPVGVAVDANANLFVLNAAANTVTEYAAPYTGAPTTISKGLSGPNSLALDTRGNLFVANLNSTPNSVVEYTPPFTNQSVPVATITNGVNEQGAIGLSASATLFVPNQGANTVTEYTAPYAGTPATIAGGQSEPIALAIDVLGNLYVANHGNNTVTEYPAPYAGGPWTTYSAGVSSPVALALSPPTNSGAALLP